MRHLELKLTFRVYPGGNGLDPDDRALIDRAKQAAGDAYAPYSGFRVGAALMLANGEIVTGNNQENVAYPSGLCAERVALFAASSRFPGVPVHAMAIAAETENFTLTEPVYPCGGCRQVMSEYEASQGQPIRVLMAGPNQDALEAPGVDHLLPLRFSAEQLRKSNR
ncbi:MAG: cytidine deaminase [Bacteroidales bacterium]|nr:cytidine deaminase [Bacteroidales bacterium]